MLGVLCHCGFKQCVDRQTGFRQQQTDRADGGRNREKAAATQATVVNQINSGWNKGNWQGNGITSSTAAGAPGQYGVGLFDNAILGLTMFGGVSVNANSLLVTPALLGDANLDGHVNAADLEVICHHWHQSVADWAEGDLNLDGYVDSLDVAIVVAHWDPGVPFPTVVQLLPGIRLYAGGSGAVKGRSCSYFWEALRCATSRARGIGRGSNGGRQREIVNSCTNARRGKEKQHEFGSRPRGDTQRGRLFLTSDGKARRNGKSAGRFLRGGRFIM